MCGSATCSTKAMATAASKALPPRSRTAIPVPDASQWVLAAMPNVPTSSGRVVNMPRALHSHPVRVWPPGAGPARRPCGPPPLHVHETSRKQALPSVACRERGAGAVAVAAGAPRAAAGRRLPAPAAGRERDARTGRHRPDGGLGPPPRRPIRPPGPGAGHPGPGRAGRLGHAPPRRVGRAPLRWPPGDPAARSRPASPGCWSSSSAA